MSQEGVKKIDRKTLEALSKGQLIDLFLNTFDQLMEANHLLRQQVLQLQNEILLLKGEKKSPNFRMIL